MSEINKLKNALQAADHLNRQLSQELEQMRVNNHALYQVYQVFGATVIDYADGEVNLHVSSIDNVFNMTREIHQDGELICYKVEIVEYMDTYSTQPEGE